MGVDLRDIVKPRPIQLEALSGRVIAFDAYNALYAFLSVIRGEAGEPLMDSHGRITSHLSGLFYRNINFLSLSIRPLYVFDGIPPSLKSMEIARRRAVKEEAVIKYSEALQRGDMEAARKYAQATAYIKDYMVEDAKRLLDCLGIPYVDAPSEGEATAAHLTQTGVAYAVASQDFDSLLFGAKILVRNLTISGKRKLPNKPIYVNIEPEIIDAPSLTQSLGLTREQLVDVGILVGTDFNPDGFKGVGPAKALKLIKTYGRLEDIPEIQEELSKIDYRAIREIFLHPKVPGSISVRWNEPDEDAIIQFLVKERSFSEERVRNALARYREAAAKRTSTLESWFQ